MEMIGFDKEIYISISISIGINIGSSQTHIQWSGDGCRVGTWRPWADLLYGELWGKDSIRKPLIRIGNPLQ